MGRLQEEGVMASCPSCRKDVGGLPLENACYNGEDFRLLLCSGCGLMFWSPPVMPDRSFYENVAEKENKACRVRHTIGARSLGLNHRFFLQEVKSSHGILLDVGCGDGLFLAAAQRAGFEVWGIDMDTKALRTAEKRGLKNIYPLTLEGFMDQLSRRQLRFDVITFFEVLEHQADPGGFMENVRGLLRPGSIISGSVPNRNRFKVMADAKWDRPPYHFTSWDRGTLHRFLFLNGFTEICVRDIGFGYHLPSLLGGLVHRVKKVLIKEVGENTLTIYSLEELKEIGRISTDVFKKAKALKTIKGIMLYPFLKAEALVELASGKGLSLYFRARLR
jgi:SAM-dependent methyltransferase